LFEAAFVVKSGQSLSKGSAQKTLKQTSNLPYLTSDGDLTVT
jgi:hypothetical protein